MPKLKPTDRDRRIADLHGLISKYSTLYGFDINGIVAVLGISRTGFYVRRKNPELWRIGELEALRRVLHIPQHELIAALFGNTA